VVFGLSCNTIHTAVLSFLIPPWLCARPHAASVCVCHRAHALPGTRPKHAGTR
jgi:hypothetical protein